MSTQRNTHAQYRDYIVENNGHVTGFQHKVQTQRNKDSDLQNSQDILKT